MSHKGHSDAELGEADVLVWKSRLSSAPDDLVHLPPGLGAKAAGVGRSW